MLVHPVNSQWTACYQNNNYVGIHFIDFLQKLPLICRKLNIIPVLSFTLYRFIDTHHSNYRFTFANRLPGFSVQIETSCLAYLRNFPLQLCNGIIPVIIIFRFQLVFFSRFEINGSGIRRYGMCLPRINQHLIINAQAATVIGCKAESIATGNGRFQLSRPTDRQRRFGQERIGSLIGRFKVDPTLFTHSRGAFEAGIVKILSLQSFREVLSLNKFQSIGSRFPGSIDDFHPIAHPVSDTL